MFIGKIVPLNLSALEEVPGWVSRGIERCGELVIAGDG